jgi:hypothetical protein
VVKTVAERENATVLEEAIGQVALDREVQVIHENVNEIVNENVAERKIQQNDVYLYQILHMNSAGKS